MYSNCVFFHLFCKYIMQKSNNILKSLNTVIKINSINNIITLLSKSRL